MLCHNVTKSMVAVFLYLSKDSLFDSYLLASGHMSNADIYEHRGHWNIKHEGENVPN